MSGENAWKGPFAALWFMQFVAMFAMSEYLPFLPLYVQFLGVRDVGLAATWSGLLFGVGFLFAALMAPVWGHVADRWGRKRMVLRAMLGSGAALAFMAYARSVNDLLFLRIVHGSLGGFVSASTALAATLVPERRMGFALGALQAASMTGLILGPMTGGVLLDAWGFREIILLSAALMAAGALVVWALVPDDHDARRRAEAGGVMANLRFVISSPVLLSAAGVQFVVQAGLMSVNPVLALFVQELGAPAEGLGRLTGLVFGVTGVTTMVGAFVWGRRGDRRGAVPVLQACLLGAAAVYLPQPFLTALVPLFLCRAALGFCVGGIHPAAQTLIARETPAARRAGVLGVTFSASLLGNAVGPIVGGAAAGFAGVRAPFIGAAALLALAWFLSRRYMKSGRAPLPVSAAELES